MSKLKDYALRINELVKQLEKKPSDKIKKDITNYTDMIISGLKNKKLPVGKKAKAVKVKKEKFLDKKLRKKYMKDIELDEEYLDEFTKPRKEAKTTKEVEYTIYKTSNYGKLSNRFFEKTGVYLTKSYPDLFRFLYKSLRESNIKILSKTYVSILLFSSFIVCFSVLFLTLVLSILFDVGIFSSLIRAFAFAIVGGIVTFAMIYFYPSTIVNSKRKAIKNDLPFVILHMAAVAGSGAQPISIFNLVLSSGEYKGLEPEIKKIVNYVNLFGYDLSTALRAVAKTTPSPEFKELLTGITSTIETGGNLKSYLKGKAEDTLSTYKLERKKYVQSLGTYSDVYTGILIAAPLLFSVTLTIINMLGGKIGPFEIKTLAFVGVYGIIPLLNVGFIVFLNSIQP